MKWKTLGSYLTVISLLKRSSTTFVAPSRGLFTTSGISIQICYVTSSSCVCYFKTWLLQQHSSRPTLLRLEKLQRLQNTAARLTVRAKRSAHIIPVLKNLHWLPVKERIIFKILLWQNHPRLCPSPFLKMSCYSTTVFIVHYGQVA